jgi:cyclohexyl-isocyanide hydratase
MPYSIGILCFPKVQQLDLTGPYEVFASASDVEVKLVWKTREPIRSATGLWLTPEATFLDAPAFDVICIPGGGGVNALLTDCETLDYLKAVAAQARFVTSVCTGSLVLGAAGLLRGRRATTHWNAMDFLHRFGAHPIFERVVKDGPVLTAAGVTSGIDFGFLLLEELVGRDEAETVQLMLEYDPAPPFSSGTPGVAQAHILSEARRRVGASRREREALLLDSLG